MAEQEERRGKVNFHIINIIPRPICNVKFKILPFYQDIFEVIQPMAVYCVPTVNPDLNQQRCQEYTKFEIDFGLPELTVRIIKEKKNSAQLQIRFGKEQPGMMELSEGLPEPIQISVNSHTAIAHRSPINFNCCIFLLLNDTDNKISVLWPHCKEPYYMTVNIVESLTIEHLVKRVQFNNKLCGITLNTKAKIIAFLKNTTNNPDEELCDLVTYKLSLLCSITKSKMKLPTRSIKCSHLQSFDLYALFSLNLIKPKWKCPVCNIHISVNELVVDTFLLDIINSPSLPENCIEIMMFKNGNWEPYIEPKKEFIEDDQSGSDKEHSENTVDLDY